MMVTFVVDAFVRARKIHKKSSKKKTGTDKNGTLFELECLSTKCPLDLLLIVTEVTNLN